MSQRDRGRISWREAPERASRLKQALLSVVLRAARFRGLEAQVLVGQPRGAAAPGRPGQKAHLHQVGLAEIFQRDGLFAQSRRQRFQAHRAAVVHLNERLATRGVPRLHLASS